MFSPIVSRKSPYRSALSQGEDPSLPTCPVFPYGPMSSQWSLVPFARPIDHVRTSRGGCLYKVSIASVQAEGPSLDIILCSLSW